MLEIPRAAVALHFGWLSFCRIHRTLRVMPAMEAGIAAGLWSVNDVMREALTTIDRQVV